MIPLNLLRENSQLNEFIRDTEDFEILIKDLNQDEIKRLNIEYPKLLKLKTVKKETKEQTISKSVICITLVKKNLEAKSYDKLKKFKIYYNKSEGKIIKILKN